MAAPRAEQSRMIGEGMLSMRAIQSDLANTYWQVMMADATIWPTHQDVAGRQYDADMAAMGFYHSYDPQARAAYEQEMGQPGMSAPEPDAQEPEIWA